MSQGRYDQEEHASFSNDPWQRRFVKLRADLLNMLHAAVGGHYGGCLSVIDILATLYSEVIRLTPKNVNEMGRDRLILSKGHAAAALYVVLADLGLIEHAKLSGFGTAESS